MALGLPPLAEQKRIVERVDALFALCDALSAGGVVGPLGGCGAGGGRGQQPVTFDEQYPNLAAWILGGDAWIELGQNDFSYSYVRVLDIGGLIWESDEPYRTVSEALADAEAVLQAWLAENG